MAYVKFASVIPQDCQTIFDYITDMNKYITLMPSDLSLILVTPAIKMKVGAEYEFQMKRFGLVRTWTTKIDAYKKNEYFVEYETSLLFKTWRHECRLKSHGEQKTLLINHLEYSVGFGLIGKLVDDLWLRKDLKRIFEHTHQKLIISL